MVNHSKDVICEMSKKTFPEEAREFCKVIVKNINQNVGSGVFAEEFIKANSIIASAGGVVVNSVEHIPPHLKYAVLIDEKKYVAPKDYSKLENMWFINHSCNSNIARVGGLLLIAKRDIQKGEEITIDYAPLVATEKNWNMDCCCGSHNCRKKITGDDWQNPSIAQALWLEWLPFIQKQIINKGLIK